MWSGEGCGRDVDIFEKRDWKQWVTSPSSDGIGEPSLGLLLETHKVRIFSHLLSAWLSVAVISQAKRKCPWQQG